MNRCRNCGWDNPNGVLVCEKCKRSLSGTIDQVNNNITKQDDDNNFNPKETLKDSNVFGEKKCRICGYPLRQNIQECPNCGNSVNEHNNKKDSFEEIKVNTVKCKGCGELVNDSYIFCPNCGSKLHDNNKHINVSNDYTATIRPNRLSKMYKCFLTMLMDEGEKGEPCVLEFSGQSEIILNRGNTESDNMTITSKEQACLMYDNKKWYIIDKSTMETTFVRAANKIEITNGDIIMMGDRRFKFSTNE